MKKKNIIQIIIGIILIMGIGYAIYQEIERNKEDYFVIGMKEKNINEIVKKNDVEILNKWVDKNEDIEYIKIKTKVKIYNKLLEIKGVNIEYVDKTDGLDCMKKNVSCEILFISGVSEKIKQEVFKKYKLNKGTGGSLVYFKTKPNNIHDLKKEKYVQKINAFGIGRNSIFDDGVVR